MWFGKFNRLMYIAYLNCERTIKTVSLIVIGMVTGLLLYSLFIPHVLLPVDTAFAVYALTTMGMMNAIILTALAFIYILLLVFSLSGIHVAYLYDNKSWGYVTSTKGHASGFRVWVSNGIDKINEQAKIDEAETTLQRITHDAAIEELVKELKERV